MCEDIRFCVGLGICLVCVWASVELLGWVPGGGVCVWLPGGVEGVWGEVTPGVPSFPPRLQTSWFLVPYSLPNKATQVHPPLWPRIPSRPQVSSFMSQRGRRLKCRSNPGRVCSNKSNSVQPSKILQRAPLGLAFYWTLGTDS